MANAMDSIDPNDLDSIDALLDEAEFESMTDSALEQEENLTDSNAGVELDSLELDNASVDSLLDDLGDDLPPKKEESPELDSTFQPQSQPRSSMSSEPERQSKTQFSEDDPDSFLEKRAAANAAQSNNKELTVTEMDSIKKLIIIFGSVAILLAAVGIGIGVWGAVSASKGLDETSFKMLEDIKVGTQHNTQKSSESGTLIKSVEKKMDALSFQLEQINADLNQLEQSKLHSLNSVADTIIDLPNGLMNDAASKVETLPKTTQVIAPQPTTVVMTQSDPGLGDKISKVSAQIVTAQARIADVNKRLKDMQDQYRTLLTSVKTVEKEVIASKVEKANEKARIAAEAEALAAEKSAPKPNGSYQYTVPGFDYNNNRDGSYP